MINIVKLILICQIKDKEIPQLIPLFWIVSRLILLIFLFVIILLFRIGGTSLHNFLTGYKSQENFYWCW